MAHKKPDKTIMIIDDVEYIRAVVAKMAESLGLHTIIVPITSDFEAEWAGNQVDLVLTDIFMPGKSGLDIITEVREALPDVPIMAMSGGLSDEQDKEDALRAAVKIGACERVLRKPFTADEFEDAMREMGLVD